MSFPLCPTKQRKQSKTIYGFDIETYKRNKSFYCASIVGDNYKKSYLSKQELINDLKNGLYNNSIICATNLGFDFFGLLFGTDLKGFQFIFRGSDLIYAKTYCYNNKFNKYSNKNKTGITFLDTLNYAKLSVKDLGNLIGLKKLPKPKFLGLKPKNKKQQKELIKYNLRDSEISQKALKFLYKSFEKLGATPKLTIASTSMSLFRNKYLKDFYFTHNEKILLEIFESYYGGRTEAFGRGLIKDYNYYDINSLYPSVMLNKFPNPNTLKTNNLNTDYYFKHYDGISKVEIQSPTKQPYPLLCVKHDGKLIFPSGILSGYYTNIELRKAVSIGYKIKKVYRNLYYTENCFPFKDFVTDLYNKRLTASKEMNKIIKLLLNSLYGKFGQKFKDKDNLIPFNHSYNELSKFKKFEIIGDFIRVVEDRKPSVFCIPIWASYVTAYGRVKLYDLIVKSKAVYCDTDSVITKSKLKTGTGLGELKLENVIKEGIIVKPKFYMINQKAKCKGIGKKLVHNDFLMILKDKKVSYTKFIKFRESLRRGKVPNEIINILKNLNLEDNKRKWNKEFDQNIFSDSYPLEIGGV